MAKHRVSVTMSWELETDLIDNQLLEFVKLQVEAIQTPIKYSKTVFRVDKLKDRQTKIRLGEVQPEDVIPYITKDDDKREYIIGDKSYFVKMNSHRYFIFRESLHCVACGLVGSRMFLEQNPSDKAPHFNLYGEENGNLVLMTKDHILARSVGGEDRHSNYQTMCIICNNLKGPDDITLEGIRELRKIYMENYGKISSKKLNMLLQEAKKFVSRSESLSCKQRRVVAAENKSKEDLVTTCDLTIWDIDGKLIGKSVYEKAIAGFALACMKKGTIIRPLGAEGKRLTIKLPDERICEISECFLAYI